MSFGKQMRLRREELHLSRAALAEELGVSPSAISNYENGVSSPKEDILLKLFGFLNRFNLHSACSIQIRYHLFVRFKPIAQLYFRGI